MLASRPHEGVAAHALKDGAPTHPAPVRAPAGPAAPVHRRTARTLEVALAQLAAAVVALGLVELALVLSGPPVGPRWVLVLFPVVGWIYLAAGIVAWLRRPTNRLGAIMVAGAGVWIAAGLANATAPALVATGLVLATLPLAIVVHLLHAFPSGRLRGTVSRATVLAGYAICLVLQAPQYLFVGGPDSQWTLLRIDERPDVAEYALRAQQVIGAAVMIVTTVILVQRMRRAAPAQQRVLAPLCVYGIAAVLYVPLVPYLSGVLPEGEVGVGMQLGVLAGVPVAFALGLLRGGFARTGELQELAAWLGADRARPALADALADALGDPSLELLFASRGGYVDACGRPAALPLAGSGRAAVDVLLGDRRVGAIVYDATLIADRAIVESAGRVVALALHNDQLTAELRSGRHRLQQALTRTVEASDIERRRIARDLHDGLQARLVLLAMQADAVRGADAGALSAGLQSAIAELRDLVQGVMPSMLTERGLCAAAEELAYRCPIPVAVDVDAAGDAFPGAIESSGYFIVAEALANVVKHSHAATVGLRMTRDDGHLRIELRDDGVGGAHLGGGAGLRGMADRVDALDGRLSVHSPPGGGTRIVAELPCAS